MIETVDACDIRNNIDEIVTVTSPKSATRLYVVAEIGHNCIFYIVESPISATIVANVDRA